MNNFITEKDFMIINKILQDRKRCFFGKIDFSISSLIPTTRLQLFAKKKVPHDPLSKFPFFFVSDTMNQCGSYHFLMESGGCTNSPSM